MQSKKLFSWFFRKIFLILFILAGVAACFQSNNDYSTLSEQLELSLYKRVSELVSTNTFSSQNDQTINVTLIDEEGNVVIDGYYGALQSMMKSEEFKSALVNEPFIKKTFIEGKEFIAYWGRLTYQGKPHVLTARVHNSNAYASVFLFNFSVNIFWALFLNYIICRRITPSIDDFLEKATDDIKAIDKESFIAGGNINFEIDKAIEFNSQLKTLNDNVEEEYKRLRKDVNQWQVFFSTIPRGLLAIDQDRTIINCNQRSLDMVSLQNKDIQTSIGDSIMSVFRNADLNNISKDFLESQSYLKEYEFEQTVENNVETFKLIAVELTLDNLTNKTGMLLIIENITALRHLENMRRDFVANVSHELKTPIAIIAGFVETLKDCMDDPDNAARFLAIIEKNVSRLSTIIDDLFSLSKLEQNESLVRKDFEKKSIEETVGAAIDVCTYGAEKKKIHLIVDLEDSKYYKKKTMFANHRLLEQAVRNLIENAVKYSPEGTNVEISSKKVDDNILISVKDSGPGIAEEHHVKVFERFYRIDKSRDRQTGGSGLGLAIVKHILRIHNGNISLQSKEGEGCVFTMSVPYISKKKAREIDLS